MNNMVIEVNGEKLEVLFTFNNDNINYIVYLNSKDEIGASRYTNDGELILSAIESDEEWDLVDKKIEEMDKE